MRCEHLLPAAGGGRSWSLAFTWLLRDLVAVAPSRISRVLQLLPNTCVSTRAPSAPGPHGMPPLLPEVPHPMRDAVAALQGHSPTLCLSVDLLRDLGVVFKVRSPPESVLLVSSF